MQRDEGSYRRERQRAGRKQVARGDAERVPEEDLAEAGRHFRPERQEHAEPEKGRDDDRDCRVGANPALTARQGDRDSGDQQPSTGTQEQRKAGQGRDHEAGQRRVGERFGGVALAVEDQPDAERSTDQAEERDLGQCPLADLAGKRICEPVQHGSQTPTDTCWFRAEALIDQW